MFDSRGSEVVATYDISSYLPLERAAAVLAGEQSSGTFTKVALESDELIRDHGAEVRSVEVLKQTLAPLPGSWMPAGGKLTTGRISVAFPLHNFGPSIGALLTTLSGNLYELKELASVKLIDVDLPPAFGEKYHGARFGLSGTRRLLRAEGAMIGTIVKPSIGLPLDVLGPLVRDLALADIDFIKDDELNANPPYAPFADRVATVMREIHDVADRTGKKTMYAFNVTGDIDEMLRNADLVAEHGGDCVMLAIPEVGFPALSHLRANSDLVIHGHRAGFGALDRSPRLGVGFMVFQQLAQLAGADHLHVSGINGKFWESNETIAANTAMIRSFSGVGEAMVPVLSSGQTPATAADTFRFLRTDDLLVLAGGGVHAHPGGVVDGVQSLREAWSAVVAGQNPEAVAAPGSALDVALKTFSGVK
ncbi:RuBisCO large subunit C-terminal-like domain-containing protein [Cryobacterium sp. Y62]|uniref:RuBisCO large subunit C-terminal-like domain-containing protein n=1 Tax=Cryobacterium sp. Y62 TaxID=2048284 RepID=UPI002100B699|nr:RuBisCO large subunit C-terminal-like domain-containing protein [Cryobacterium sp. Y62]